MSRIKKELRPLDQQLQTQLKKAVEQSKITQETIRLRTGISRNRVGIILRLETPPASAGELDAIAKAAGSSLTQLFNNKDVQHAAAQPLPNPQQP